MYSFTNSKEKNTFNQLPRAYHGPNGGLYIVVAFGSSLSLGRGTSGVEATVAFGNVSMTSSGARGTELTFGLRRTWGPTSSLVAILYQGDIKKFHYGIPRSGFFFSNGAYLHGKKTVD